MAASGYTPILLYASGTATNVPLAANLTSSASGAELAINYADGKLFYKDSGGVVQVLATKGGVGSSSNTQVLFNSSGLVAGSASLTWDGTNLLTNNITSAAATNLLLKSAGTTAVTIDTSQNVGIGVTPSAWGSNFKAVQVGRGTALWSGTATDATFLSQNAYYDGTNFKYLQTAYASYYSSQLGQHLWYTAPSGTAGNTISFTQAMTLNASGNLGIGTTSPAVKLQVVSDNPIRMNNAASSSQADLYFGDSGATLKIENFYSTGSNITFGTNANGAGVVERARIDSSGNFMVGVTTAGSGGLSGFSFNSPTGSSNVWIGHTTGTASGTAYVGFNYNGSGIGSITQSGTTAVLYNVMSDQRLKENIVDADDAASLIDSLQVRKFDWKTDNTHQRYGFIAQELVTVAPEAVHQPINEEDMMAVDYSKLVPMLVKEIQSLRKRLITLEAK